MLHYHDYHTNKIENLQQDVRCKNEIFHLNSSKFIYCKLTLFFSIHEGYDDQDITVNTQKFKPSRPPGVHLPGFISRERMAEFTTALDFFKLFFTLELVSEICTFTNTQAMLNLSEDSAYGDKGKWNPVTPEEMYHYIGNSFDHKFIGFCFFHAVYLKLVSVHYFC